MGLQNALCGGEGSERRLMQGRNNQSVQRPHRMAIASDALVERIHRRAHEHDPRVVTGNPAVAAPQERANEQVSKFNLLAFGRTTGQPPCQMGRCNNRDGQGDPQRSGRQPANEQRKQQQCAKEMGADAHRVVESQNPVRRGYPAGAAIVRASSFTVVNAIRGWP